jgi:putative endopeptidase
MSVSGIDLGNRDPRIRPQDDLYGHVNGAWLESFAMPTDRAADGAFRELHDQAEAQVRDIVAALADAVAGGAPPAADSDEHRIGALYASFMDAEAADAAGADPIRPDLKAVAGAATREDLARVLGVLERTGVGGVFHSWVDTDPADPARYVVNLVQGGIGLPDEAYYREDQFAAVRDAYVTHIATMLALACEGRLPGTPARAAERIYALEAALAASHWDVVASRDDTLTYNPRTMADLAAAAPGFPWRAWLDGLGAPEGSFDRLVVRQPSYLEAMARAWEERELDDWRAWAAWRVVQSRAPLLSSGIVAENFAFTGRILSGTEELRERWKRGISLVEGELGESVGKTYVARHFPAAHKERVSVIVANLLTAYRESITALAWMGPETKAKALAKLGQFTPKIGYPDRWRDFGALRLDPRDLVGNVRAASAFETDRELAKLAGPVDRGEWFMTPQTVNAYYNPGMNEIVFPAAILQPPFFDAGADDAANYGGIGAVIGHEIGHGFDDQGSKYDGEGRLADWWTEADREEFERRTAALIAQYDAYVPRRLAAKAATKATTEAGDDGDPATAPHVNGALTIGENIGDLGGLSIAWRAYRIAVEAGEASEAAEIDGMSPAVRFFSGWAGSWRTEVRDVEEVRRLTTDPHSPAEFRCNGVVRNLAAFHEAYGVEPGDALYLAPEERVTIW